jgi:hypothetical protein
MGRPSERCDEDDGGAADVFLRAVANGVREQERGSLV